jgi:electron transport complex protein RnfE
MGIGFTLVLVTLGGMREFVGQGTLFYQANLLLGEAATVLTVSLGEGYQGALIAILPPGAFIGLGLLIALKNVIDKRAKRRAAARVAKSAPTPASDTPLPVAG